MADRKTEARVAIQQQDFNVADEIATLRKDDTRVGAVCSFIGTVRDRNIVPANATSKEAATADDVVLSSDIVLSMELEHYPGMTEKAIEAMIDEACERFDIFAARVVHRIGLLAPLDQVVLVAVTAAHRGESFKACE